MLGNGRSHYLVRFDAFQLDIRTGELSKNGVAVIRLSEQPLRLLVALLERPGELVLREELRRRLWPNNTVVEFQHGINAGIKRLRLALGDPADSPLYIETLVRRGYRWKTSVEWLSAPQPDKPLAIPAGGNLSGRRVSHYRVLELLGGGGMGLVYAAEDVRLGRRVALKFLPEELSADTIAIERFRREARAGSMPDHPNICTVYEVGEFQDAPFIAMQLLEGQPLSERIDSMQQFPLPLDELLSIAVQVADGLDAAHREGVIHRDIKPANIFITTRGEAKILDFGLAKLAGVEEDSEADREPHTSRAPEVLLTRTGVALGTASYMSPEQVRGEKLDTRTDLFSFGLVLYEMSTGRRAFHGASAADIHDAILKQLPVPLTTVNPELPHGLVDVIEKALMKDCDSRYQSASELSFDLQHLRQTRHSANQPSPQPLPWHRPISRSFFYLASLLVFLFVIGGFWIVKRSSSPPANLKLQQLTWNSSEIPVRRAAISPYGKYLAYTDFNGIHIKSLATNQIRTIPAPGSLRTSSRVDWSVIAWFPDGGRFLAQIAPFGEGCTGCDPFSTWLVSASGGLPRKIRDASAAESISPDGTLIAFTAVLGNPGGRQIWVMDANGAHARMLFETDQRSWMRHARWSPDGRRLAYVHVRETPGQNVTLESRPMMGGPAVVILPNAKRVHDFVWLPDGNLIYGVEEAEGNNCNYWKQQIDTSTGQSKGQAAKLTRWAGFCLDSTTATRDAKRLVFTQPQSRSAIFVTPLQKRGGALLEPARLSLNEAATRMTGWTPDSRSIVFASNRDGAWGFYKQSLNSDNPEPIINGLEWIADMSAVTPDGKWVLYIAQTDKLDQMNTRRLMRVPIGGGPSEVILSGPLRGVRCAKPPADTCMLEEFSPDYKRLLLSKVDTARGRGPTLFQFNAEENASWDLSPDGTKVLLFGGRGPVRIKWLLDQTPHQVLSKAIDYCTWANNSEGFYGSSPTQRGDILLHIDLQGRTDVIWKRRGSLRMSALPSPDLRHLAIESWTLSSNAWMLENF